MTEEEIQIGIEERKAVWSNALKETNETRFVLSSFYIANNISFDFDELIQPILDKLPEERDPDFQICNYFCKFDIFYSDTYANSIHNR